MLRLDKICRRWNGFLLRDISLEINKGEYFVLLGPCGAGKTLLLNCIAGIYRLDSGRIFIGKEDITAFHPEKRKIGYLFQKSLIFPHLNIKDNICYGLRYHKPDKDYIKHIFEVLGIDDLSLRKDAFNLSGGEAQKIALARTLVIRPRVLLLDEPFTSLDPHTRKNALKVLKSLNEKLNLPVLHVTHNLEEARFLADSIGVLINGEIIAKGAPEDVMKRMRSLHGTQYFGDEV